MQSVRLTLPMEIEFDCTTLAASSWPNSFQFRNFTLCPPLLTSIVAKFMERNDAVKSLTACVFSPVRLSKKGWKKVMEKSGTVFNRWLRLHRIFTLSETTHICEWRKFKECDSWLGKKKAWNFPLWKSYKYGGRNMRLEIDRVLQRVPKLHNFLKKSFERIL